MLNVGGGYFVRLFLYVFSNLQNNSGSENFVSEESSNVRKVIQSLLKLEFRSQST